MLENRRFWLIVYTERWRGRIEQSTTGCFFGLSQPTHGCQE